MKTFFKIMFAAVALLFVTFLPNSAEGQNGVDSSAFYSQNSPPIVNLPFQDLGCNLVPNGDILGTVANNGNYWLGLDRFGHTVGTLGRDEVPNWGYMASSPNFALPGHTETIDNGSFTFSSTDNMVQGSYRSGCLNMGSYFEAVPNYMLAQIQQAAESGLSDKEYLELAISEQGKRYHNAIRGQIALLEADSLATASDYDAVLASAEGLGYQIRLVKAYTAVNNDAAASNVLLDIPNRVTLSAAESANYADYVTFQPIAQRLKTQPIDSLSATELQTLSLLAGNKNSVQVKARALTEAATHTRTYLEAMPQVAQSRTSPSKTRIKNAKINSDLPNIITIMPNPAKDYINVETPTQNGTLYIYNAQGILITKTNISQNNTVISTNEWASGMYLYEYTSTEQPVLHGKLQIIH